MTRLSIALVVALVVALASCSGKTAHTFVDLPAGGDRAVCAHGSAPRVQHDTTVVPMPVIVPTSSGQ